MTRTVVHIPEEINNKYRFVVVAGKRCEQLQRGAFPKVQVFVPLNRNGQQQEPPKLASFWAQVAIQEVEKDLIAWETPEIKVLDYTTEAPISME